MNDPVLLSMTGPWLNLLVGTAASSPDGPKIHKSISTEWLKLVYAYELEIWKQKTPAG